MISLVDNSPMVYETKIKMWKVYDDAKDIDKQSLIRKFHLSSRLKWAKICKIKQ